MRICVFALLLFGLASPSPAQEQSAQPEALVFRLNVREVSLDAQILNKKTRKAVEELKQEDFQVYEDNVLQHVTAFSRDKFPLSIVILFDLTDSVQPVLKTLAAGAQEALQHLKPEDEVTVMVYAAATQVLQEATTDRALAAAAIEKASHMKSDEAAFFNEGIFQAAGMLAKGNPSSRRVIIWLTDNVPNIPSESEIPLRYRHSLKGEMPHSQKDAMEQLLHTGTVVCSLVKQSDLSVDGAMGLNSHMVERMMHPPGEVYKYATATGGQVIEYRKKDLTEKLALMIDDLRMRYIIGYHPATQKAKGRFSTIKVKLTPDALKATGNVVVEAKQGYYW